MKNLKKFFLSIIIFLVILFLQIFFSDKNFAKEPEKFTKDFNLQFCKNDIFSEMRKIKNENRDSFYDTSEEIGISLREKGEIVAYNFRVLSCNFEFICSDLQNFMFYGEDGKKENKTNGTGVIAINSFCPELKINREIFQHCGTNDTKQFQEILQFCEENKEKILYGSDGKSGEFGFIKNNFENDAKKDKVNFLSARIYDLNEKMRGLAENMNRLKVEIVNIVSRIVCTEK